MEQYLILGSVGFLIVVLFFIYPAWIVVALARKKYHFYRIIFNLGWGWIIFLMIPYILRKYWCNLYYKENPIELKRRLARHRKNRTKLERRDT